MPVEARAVAGTIARNVLFYPQACVGHLVIYLVDIACVVCRSLPESLAPYPAPKLEPPYLRRSLQTQPKIGLV
jgi:hypothetical protein